MSPEIISTDKTIYYYFFSATPQVLAGAIALVGVFYIFAYREMRDMMKSIPKLLQDFVIRYSSQNRPGSIEDQKYKELLVDFEPSKQYPTKENVDLIIKLIENYFTFLTQVNPPNITLTKDQWGKTLELYRQAYDNLNLKVTRLSMYTKICIMYNSVIIAASLILLASVNYETDHYLHLWMGTLLCFAIIGIFIVALTVYSNIRPSRPDL